MKAQIDKMTEGQLDIFICIKTSFTSTDCVLYYYGIDISWPPTVVFV